MNKRGKSSTDGGIPLLRKPPPHVNASRSGGTNHVDNYKMLSLSHSGSWPEALQSNIIHTAINRLPPPVTPGPPNQDHPQPLRPVKIGFVLNTFSYGGSETETIELVRGADPHFLQFTGIALLRPLPLPQAEPPRDGTFPPIYTSPNDYIDESDTRVRIVDDFKDAIKMVADEADILITWGVSNLQEYLPAKRLPKIVVHSKDSGTWAESFLQPNSLVTSYYVGNSTLAASAFPSRIRSRVRVIHDGVNPQRVLPRINSTLQRRIWGLSPGDKVVGYLGRIEMEKGVFKNVDGIASLTKDWKAVFIGANPNSRYYDELLSYCERVIPGRFKVLGWCHDVGSALGAFDVFCHPSAHEGFSNSIAEAWLAGVPTIYTQNTGAVPDLGELGISVSPEADGEEIACAILRAYQNTELTKRARDVMENNFLISHNIRRWTEYLLEVHRQPRQPRLALLFSSGMVYKIPDWLREFEEHWSKLELSCLIIESNGGRLNKEAGSEYQPYSYPSFNVHSREEVERLILYTRPDIVLSFGVTPVWELLPINSPVHIIIASSDPSVDEDNWARWIQYLKGGETDHVFT